MHSVYIKSILFFLPVYLDDLNRCLNIISCALLTNLKYIKIKNVSYIQPSCSNMLHFCPNHGGEAVSYRGNILRGWFWSRKDTFHMNTPYK